jgi:deaminated glutathione amidase
MRVAVCQMRSGDDVEKNVAEAERLLRDAGEDGADLAVLPELFPYLGPRSGLPEVAERLPGGPISSMLAETARSTGMWVVGGSVPELDEGRVYNTSPLFDPSGELVARYRKIHLFDVDLEGQPPFRESAEFAAGSELVTHVVGDIRVGFAICYDLRFPELFRGLMTLGAELFVLPSQFQEQTGRAHWEVLVRARAIEDQCFVAAAAQWGAFGPPDEERRSFGTSMIVGPWGEVLARAPEEGTGVWSAELDPSELRRVRAILPALEHRRLGITC